MSEDAFKRVEVENEKTRESEDLPLLHPLYQPVP
jgi:hypothetical protein